MKKIVLATLALLLISCNENAITPYSAFQDNYTPIISTPTPVGGPSDIYGLNYYFFEFSNYRNAFYNNIESDYSFTYAVFEIKSDYQYNYYLSTQVTKAVLDNFDYSLNSYIDSTTKVGSGVIKESLSFNIESININSTFKDSQEIDVLELSLEANKIYYKQTALANCQVESIAVLREVISKVIIVKK